MFIRRHYLFLEANSFPRVKIKENYELQGTVNVQGQIPKHIFVPIGGYCVYYPIFFATCAFLKIGEYQSDIRQF